MERPTDWPVAVRGTTSPATIAWAVWKMARPTHLLLIGLVYLMGALFATRSPSLAGLVAGAVPLLFAAASVHYANEYADQETDALTERTPFSGGSGALPRTGLPPRLALGAGAVTLVTAAGLAILLRGALSPAALGLLLGIVVLGWGYSVGPVPLAWHGVGEVDNALVGGLLLPLYGAAVQTGTPAVGTLLAALPFAVLVFLNLLDTTWPDRRADAAVGKRTLAVRWRARRLRATYHVGLAVWVGSLAVLVVAGGPLRVVVAYALVAPLLVVGDRWYTRRRSPLPTVAAMVLAAGLQVGVVLGPLALDVVA